jgi:hypothetical protein
MMKVYLSMGYRWKISIMSVIKSISWIMLNNPFKLMNKNSLEEVKILRMMTSKNRRILQRTMNRTSRMKKKNFN